MKTIRYEITSEQRGARLDQFLTAKEELGLSRSQIKLLIEAGNITVNGNATKTGHKLKENDLVSLILPESKPLSVQPEKIPLKIVYEDDDIIVVNKPKGMVTHPAPGNYSGTLVNALLAHTKLANLGAPLRPGIVHRLDKDTSGLIVAAKNDAAYLSLAKQIKDRTVEKTYLALVHGIMKEDDGIIEANIGRHPVNRKKMTAIKLQTSNFKLQTKSRTAHTSYKVLKRFDNYSLLEVKIKTGRTHQIRVHMSHIGHPLVGDATYGKKNDPFKNQGQFLHAYKLAFTHPKTGERLELQTDPPAELINPISL
ncbi:MAG: RluA family pseudouridine synthase [bacterium]